MKNYFNSVENRQLVGNRVSMVKDRYKLKIIELAKQLGISHSFLSQIISGKRKPSYEFLFALSVKFNINLYWLFTGNGEMIDTKRMDNDIYNLVQELSSDSEVVTLLFDLQIPAMRHFLLAQHQLLSGSPEFRYQKEKLHVEKEVK